MARLSAKMSASFAKNVYELTDAPNLNLALKRLEQSYGTMLDVEQNNVAMAKTGGPAFIKSRTAFGLCLLGKGAYQGHAFIILRGTRFLADWLTNLNIGTSRSAYGQSIHNGFHQAFLSMQTQLNPFITALASKGIHSVHCIGHSLGGALATVCAEHIKASTSFKPYLYTFGAPRVGMRSFADILSSNLGPKRMFRVYHRTGIVPCIPFWPFVHAPTLLSASYDYFQPSPGEFPGGKWHDMGLYAETLGEQKWSALRGKRNKHYDDVGIEHWLNKKGPISFSVTNLEWLDKAINYVLTKCLNVITDVIGGAASGVLTLMDRLAYILKKGIDLSNKLSSLVISLIRNVMAMLGMKPIIEKADVSHAFIRGIFQNLSHRVSSYCQRVLDGVMVNGQSV